MKHSVQSNRAPSEVGRHICDVTHDDNRYAHISRKIFQNPNIGVKATGRTTDAHNRELSHLGPSSIDMFITSHLAISIFKGLDVVSGINLELPWSTKGK